MARALGLIVENPVQNIAKLAAIPAASASASNGIASPVDRVDNGIRKRICGEKKAKNLKKTHSF
jgi:hypothetical protein